MDQSAHYDRCCNPFKKKDHLRRDGLRTPSDSICEKWGLDKGTYLCTPCRKLLATTAPEMTANESDDNANENAGDRTTLLLRILILLKKNE